MTDLVTATDQNNSATTSTAEPDRFQDYALPDPLMRAIDDLGFEFCTPIQGRALPFSLADYDVTGQAQTGTGKTAAFLITPVSYTHLTLPTKRIV